MGNCMGSCGWLPGFRGWSAPIHPPISQTAPPQGPITSHIPTTFDLIAHPTFQRHPIFSPSRIPATFGLDHGTQSMFLPLPFCSDILCSYLSSLLHHLLSLLLL